jgi:hypothetical protein
VSEQLADIVIAARTKNRPFIRGINQANDLNDAVLLHARRPIMAEFKGFLFAIDDRLGRY